MCRMHPSDIEGLARATGITNKNKTDFKLP